MRRVIIIWTVVSLLSVVAPSDAWAQSGSPPDIPVSLSLTDPAKAAYGPGEPVLFTLTLQNEGGDVITQRGFQGRDFSLSLQFVASGGQVVTAVEEGENPEPLEPAHIPAGDRFIYLHEVETVPAGWTWSETFDVRPPKYELVGGESYRVRAVVQMRTYPAVSHTLEGVEYAAVGSSDWWGTLESGEVEVSLVVDRDGDLYWSPRDLYGPPDLEPDCDDTDATVNPGMPEIEGNGRDDDCDAETLDVAAAGPAEITVQADRHVVSGSGSNPSSEKGPLYPLQVRAYDMSEVSGECVRRIGVSWRKYGLVWLSCRTVPGGVAEVDPTGAATLTVGSGELLLVAEYDPDGSIAGSGERSGDELYIGRSVGDLAVGESAHKYLQVIDKGDVAVPAQYKRLTGSELLIIEPEYTEWDGEQELYPFIFESVGDWEVTTSIAPPEGFVPDQESLSVEVSSELKAVQFTVTDVGSEWVDTEVSHEVRHKEKDKVKRVKSKVGVKLSRRLARKKGLDQYGNQIRGKGRGGRE